MVVGDSISQGLEGDYTWRYRLAQHLGASGGVDFVGPWTGTNRLPSAVADDYPRTRTPAAVDAAYRPGIRFDSAHYASWGRAMHETKDTIRGVVEAQQPDYLLVELGFNDLAWGINNPAGLLNDMRTFVTQARAARPDIRFLIANVPHRSPLDIVATLPGMTNDYNDRLATVLHGLNTQASPISLVDIEGPLDPAADTYDGVHPNGVGEYKIAKAFAEALSTRFGVGGAFGAIPGDVPGPAPAAPGSVTVTATPAGLTVAWPHSFGAAGYWLYQRDATAGSAWERLPLVIPADSWKLSSVVTGHTYEFRVAAARGDAESARSPTGSAVASTTTAATAASHPRTATS
ncbi:hypothetical protein I6A84_31640 [Frankia sp. CNm7]|uniref:Fibronectin type-III domain-containing protein n=1 Tax=Frankia nepalensis TaxID=1836974 RepID=A0A937UPT8_9ACTN|nr:SGNH/GDSL hydrolase family protein [Frankia nepalensis]MBL7497375.1 hypothetical protein [Frankia nepalensis]MBL7512765.1 hypothetical protein [Frankia nepalensis]MBL7522517.1 hypothetical protein [Frankia nepalensis]MBL7629413.1 hypothetical protein [Frankia nepalensis]